MKYKIGDRFKVIAKNSCGYQVGTVLTIKDVDSYDDEILPYEVDGWYLGDSTTIKDCEYNQQYNIDTFAQYILDESVTEVSRDIDCGNMVIKGRCFEDVIYILLSNGYDVAISKDDQNDFNLAKFEISYNKKSVDNF